MKTGRTLQDLAAELGRQQSERKDFVAEQGAMRAVVPDWCRGVALDGLNGAVMPIRPYAHTQFATHLGIPRRYYDRMASEQPALLAENLNTWLQADQDKKRMVRTIDGEVRALLSPRYRPLDNFELATAVLPTLMEANVEVLSAELTETRLYIKGILPSLSDELPEGLSWGAGHHAVGQMQERTGRIVAAIVISNSEVGNGTLRVEPSVFTTWCTNLAVMAQAAMKKYHVGRAFSSDANFEVLRDETRKATDAAFWMQVQDVTRAAFQEDIWQAAVASIGEAGKAPITSTALPKVVEVAAAQFKLTDGQANSVLTYLAAGGDLTRWGLCSAVTRTANDQKDYEQASSLERLGGEILDLPSSQWQAIAEAV